MVSTIPVHELEAQTRDVLRRVREGGEIIDIADDGKVLARLIPVPPRVDAETRQAILERRRRLLMRSAATGRMVSRPLMQSPSNAANCDRPRRKRVDHTLKPHVSITSLLTSGSRIGGLLMETTKAGSAIGIRELEEHTREVLHRVKVQGEAIDVADGGRIVARIVPVAAPVDREALARWWEHHNQFVAELEEYWPEEVTTAEAIADIRREL